MAAEPQFVGGTCVLAALNDDCDGVTRCHVSVAVTGSGELSGTDLGVQAIRNGAPLQRLDGPGESTLPSVTITGTTAYADYAFANPTDFPPEEIVVTLRGETAFFDVSVPIG
jgi:hypothetical protein